MRLVRVLLLAAAVAVWGSSASAQTSAIPQLSSRTGAAFTLYLNFGGFDFGTGTWGGTWTAKRPGVTPAYTADGSSAFSTTEVRNMHEMWSRAAEKYAPFNINVTTVDPAVAAGQAGSDAQRRDYYDSRAGMVHTVIGGDGGWYGSGGGVSFLDVADATYTNNSGSHTNFVFSADFGAGDMRGIGEATGHELGHALKLEHQSKWSGNTLQNEYDSGTAARAPVMGNSYGSTRGLWRIGTSSVSSTSIQNDIQVLMTNAGIGGYVDSGKGHTRQTATALPLTGTTIDFDLAKGVITPVSVTNPDPLGEANYTTDFYSIVVGPDGADVSVTLHSGRSTLTPGTADPGATLDATLRLLNASGTVLLTSDTGVFTETITASSLTAGTYYFQVSSAGADPAYFDVGSYFLTGSIVPVPEPGLVLLIGVVGLGLRSVVRRRCSA